MTLSQATTTTPGIGQRLIANTLLNFMGQFYILALSFAVVPFTVHRLGAEMYGVVTIAVSIGGFGGLLNLGIGRALAKYVSELYWKGEVDRIVELFRTAWTVTLLCAIFAFCLLVLPRASIERMLFHGDALTASVTGFAIVITAVGLFFSIITEAFLAIPVGLQRFGINNRINVVVATIRNIGSVVVLLLGYRAKGVLAVFMLGSLVLFLGYYFDSKRLIPSLSLRLRFNRADLKQLVTFSASVSVANITTLVVHRLDRVLVAYFLPVSAAAYYVVPYSIAEKVGIGVGNITSVVYPSTSELHAQGALDKLREQYWRATKMVMLVALPVTIPLVVIPSQILSAYVGADFALKSSATLQLVALGFLFNILAHMPFVTMQAISLPHISARYATINAVVNLACFLVLIPRYGILGAAYGFLASQIVIQPFFVAEVNRKLGIRWSELFRHSYLRPAVCGLAMVLVLMPLRTHVSSLPMLLLACTAAFLIYATVALIIGVDARERNGLLFHITGAIRFWRRSEC